MLIIKPKYIKKGGTIKTFLSNPYVLSVVKGAMEGATEVLRKRKRDSTTTKSKISKLINGNGVIYE